MERVNGQRYSNEFQRQAVERMNTCGNIVALARELGVSRRVLYNWRDRLDETNPPSTRSRELILRKQILKHRGHHAGQDFPSRKQRLGCHSWLSQPVTVACHSLSQ